MFMSDVNATTNPGFGHLRHVLLDDRPLVQYFGKGTFFPAIYESIDLMIRVAAKFG
jgi:hypothetical protein